LTDGLSTSFTVQSSTPAAILAVPVSGPARESMLLVGTPGSELSAFRVRVVDAANQPLPGVLVSFAITDGSGFGGEGGGDVGFVTDGSLDKASATTDANGEATVTLTLGSTFGVNLVLAVVGSLPTPAFLVGFAVDAGDAKLWVGGDPGGISDWQNANNWLPVGVPASTDNVIISVMTEISPVLSASTVVRQLTINSGVELSLGSHELEVQGDLVSLGSISATTGSLKLSGGSPHVLMGSSLPTTLMTGSYFLAENSVVNGNLTIDGATATLDATVFEIEITGDLLLQNGGLLLMPEGASTMTVRGNATFNGRAMGDESLKGGTLRIGGLFSVPCTGSFRGRTGHTLELIGTAGAQSVSMPCTGLSGTESQLGSLRISNSAGASTTNNIVIRDQVDLDAGSFSAPVAFVRRINDPSGGGR
jgi:hypothetical protein